MGFKVVTGAPCSGKSTYVIANKAEKDVVFDYDRVSAAITCQAEHTVNGRSYAHRFVMDMRSSFISTAKKGDHAAENLWFIITNLTDSVRSWLSPLEPEYIEMKASEDECLQRLAADDSRPDKDAWSEVIKKWFSDNQKQEEEVNNNSLSVDIQRKLADGREYRNIQLQNITARARENEDDGYIVEGYATTFGHVYRLCDGKYYKIDEQIDPHAFDECDMSDVIVQYDHAGRVFARTKNGTLELTVDNHGLHCRINLGGTEIGRQLYEEIKGGYTDKMSFGFVVAEDQRTETEDYENDVITVLRTITKIKKLYDVSAVSLPANDATEISARSFCDGLIAELTEDRRKAEQNRNHTNTLKLLLEVNL